MIVSFALLPLAIVSGAVAVFFLFGKLAQNHLGPESYLERVHSASGHRRWQAAYELAGYLARQDVGPRRAEFEGRMLRMLRAAGPEESQLRRYLVIGLGQVGGDRSAERLAELAKEGSESETRIYALMALGRIGSAAARPAVLEALRSDDAGIRKTAAFALGGLGAPEDLPLLSELLDDPVRDVRWNAALALARKGSAAGKGEILGLLDVERLKAGTPNLSAAERDQILLSAINGARAAAIEEALPALRALAAAAPDAAVRQAARNSAALLATRPADKP